MTVPGPSQANRITHFDRPKRPGRPVEGTVFVKPPITESVGELDDEAPDVTEHWDHEGGDVLSHTCSCGEEWTTDQSRCPEDWRGPDFPGSGVVPGS